MKVATVCSGIGSPEQALKELGIHHQISFACEIDKYARKSYLANFEPDLMLKDMIKEKWIGEEFYSDLFIGGIPCQSFSLAGKRLGELDPRGLLFYDFYKYVKQQQPKFFIIENVKGLLSDKNGETFRNWINLLGQSENGNPFFFPHEDSLMYNLHWQVLNTKDYGLPQNRERVFLVGIRNDLPNDFVFPGAKPLKLRLKDILQPIVDFKYYLSEKMTNYLLINQQKRALDFTDVEHKNIANCLTANYSKTPTDGEYILAAMRGRNPDNPKSRKSELETEQMLEINKNGISNCLSTVQKDNLVIEVKSATKKGFEIASVGDSINVEHPESKTRRGRVGKGVAQTLTTSCNQAVIQINHSKESGGKQPYQQNRVYDVDGISPCLMRDKSDLNIYNEFSIRKLTPLECFRLQGFPDSFFEKCQEVNSDTQLYKQAGNTISVTVIKAILKNLLKNEHSTNFKTAN